MVGEIAHVVYAARLLSHLGDAVSEASYWNGVTFPNIRRIEATTRYSTHPLQVRASSFTGSNDFLTGMRVHAWIDDMHRPFDTQDHVLVPYSQTLLEDELLYDAFIDWDVVRKALQTIHPDELYYVHERASVKKWHDILQTYFSHKPDNNSRIIFSQAIGLSKATAQEVNKTIDTIRENPNVHNALDHFVRDIEHAIT
ncbi:MAG: hypothetical protein ABIP54_01485 [Candidatus Andersenbacteria bacterium]